jgi:hypothetical protein
MAKKKSVFIDRAQILSFINKIGTSVWDNFTADDLVPVGNQYRCHVRADGDMASLDFYFNADQTTTIYPTGKNIEISTQIKTILESKYTYSIKEGKSYSFKKVPSRWRVDLVDYLKGLTDGSFELVTIESPKHERYKFVSHLGDSLIVNLYENGTVTLQGRPAYLCSEAISFLSYCKEVSVENIVDSVNCFHEIDIKSDDVRFELKGLLPKAYSNIDDMILKLLSPAISLRKLKIPMEDYSCYAFPALRALEGYIKYLFDTEGGVPIGHSFYKIFNNDKLLPNIAVQFNIDCQKELERLYQYLKKNRHVVFHTEQMLLGTTILESKIEADEIVNDVLDLIETSYVKIHN